MKSPLLCLLPLALFAGPVAAQSPGRSAATDERVIARCIHRSARGKPWLEKTLWGLRDREGGWIGAAVVNKNGSHDLGPMQINTWWVPRLARLLSRSPEAIRHALRHDACFNVEAARWILLLELSRTREIWAAVAGYHSRHPTARSRYLHAIAEKLRLRVMERQSRSFRERNKNRLHNEGNRCNFVDVVS